MSGRSSALVRARASRYHPERDRGRGRARGPTTDLPYEGWRAGDRALTSTGHASHALLAADPPGRCWPLPAEIPAERAVFARMAKTGDPIADVALVLFALYLGAILGRPIDRWLSKRGPSRRAADPDRRGARVRPALA